MPFIHYLYIDMRHAHAPSLYPAPINSASLLTDYNSRQVNVQCLLVRALEVQSEAAQLGRDSQIPSKPTSI